MSAWDELVTTALLGTGRRALPDGLPPPVQRLAAAQADAGLAVLDAAAGYTGYLHAGRRPASAPEPEIAPRQRLDPAPEPAQALLGALLRSGDVLLVDAWLAACTDRGLGVRAGLWTALATAAAAPRGPDRVKVQAALGERGRAFLGHNPRWRAVAAAESGPRSEQPSRPGPVSAQTLESVAELAALPGPWDDRVAEAALRHLTSGHLTAGVSWRLALALAHRAPLTLHRDLDDLAERARHTAPSRGFGEAARVLAARVLIQRTFDDPSPEETL